MLYFDIMMDLILFWVYATYYKVYKNALALMLSNIEYVKVYKIYSLHTIELEQTLTSTLSGGDHVNKSSDKCKHGLFGLLGKNLHVFDLISPCDL